jgi:subtilisin family serine protease
MRLHSLALGLLVVGLQAFAANIAVVDSGVDYKHKDLLSQIWANPTRPDVKDADGKVYKDVTNGWNFAESNNQIIDYKYLGTFSADCFKIFEVQAKILKGTATPDEKTWYANKKSDSTFLAELGKFGNFVHGTHVSGISADTATKGKIIGVKLIPTEQSEQIAEAALDRVRAMADEGIFAADDPMVKMYLGMIAQQQGQLFSQIGKFVAAVKSDVANGSFGISVTSVKPVVANLVKQLTGKDPSPADAEAYAIYFVGEIVKSMKVFVTTSPNTLYVFAAGNDATDNDTMPTSPANVKGDNSISVAATMGYASIATFSSYGAQMVEVAAPGVGIIATIPGDLKLPMSGTSMAAPFVTNVAGLVKDANPALKPVDIKKVLMETVDVKAFLAGKVKTSGIVNRARAVRAGELSASMNLAAAIAQAKTEIADVVDIFSTNRSFRMNDIMVVPLPGWM